MESVRYFTAASALSIPSLLFLPSAGSGDWVPVILIEVINGYFSMNFLSESSTFSLTLELVIFDEPEENNNENSPYLDKSLFRLPVGIKSPTCGIGSSGLTFPTFANKGVVFTPLARIFFSLGLLVFLP